MRAAALALALLAGAAAAQPAAPGRAPAFVFATVAEGRAVLGARDDYVLATSPLERSAKLKTGEAVDEERFREHMRNAVQDWTPEQRKNLAPLLDRMAGFLKATRWRMPDRILLVQSDATLEDDAPHTRANAIIVPRSFYEQGPGAMAYVLAHETFHVLSRNNPELREALYAAIGFKRCDTVSVPATVERLRITNPDAVESRHTIALRYEGRPVDVLPYIRFPAETIDPRAGFMRQVQVAWLPVDREGGACRVRAGPLEAGLPPQAYDGLFEQVGRNTQYLFHPEEILADNFTQLFFSTLRGSTEDVASPEVLEKMRRILFD
ncbi:MAG: hypothetical protein ACREUW_14520 [Burkholderiales bacterium]